MEHDLYIYIHKYYCTSIMPSMYRHSLINSTAWSASPIAHLDTMNKYTKIDIQTKMNVAMTYATYGIAWQCAMQYYVLRAQ